jgi:hypothetical protein
MSTDLSNTTDLDQVTFNNESAFIEDGYTATAYIAARRNIHSEVRFSFRPCVVEERTKVINAVRKDDDNADLITGDMLSKKITKWSLPSGKLNAKSIMKLKPAIFNRLFDIVITGIDGGDVDPDKSDKSTKENDLSSISALEDSQKN